MSYSYGSEAPKAEGGLPARLFRNGVSPPKSEEAGKDACTTFSIHTLSISSPFGLIPPFYPETSGCLKLSRTRVAVVPASGHFLVRL